MDAATPNAANPDKAVRMRRKSAVSKSGKAGIARKSDMARKSGIASKSGIARKSAVASKSGIATKSGIARQTTMKVERQPVAPSPTTRLTRSQAADMTKCSGQGGIKKSVLKSTNATQRKRPNVGISPTPK